MGVDHEAGERAQQQVEVGLLAAAFGVSYGNDGVDVGVIGGEMLDALFQLAHKAAGARGSCPATQWRCVPTPRRAAAISQEMAVMGVTFERIRRAEGGFVQLVEPDRGRRSWAGSGRLKSTRVLSAPSTLWLQYVLARRDVVDGIAEGQAPGEQRRQEWAGRRSDGLPSPCPAMNRRMPSWTTAGNVDAAGGDGDVVGGQRQPGDVGSRSVVT